MDWAASAGTVVYVPYLVAKDNEAPKASLGSQEIKSSAGSTSPDALQNFGKTKPLSLHKLKRMYLRVQSTDRHRSNLSHNHTSQRTAVCREVRLLRRWRHDREQL